MFDVIRKGTASVVTGRIRHFTATGVQLETGEELAADVIVTATGLNLQMLAGVAITVDGRSVTAADSILHEGVMLSGMPNLAIWFGYTTASWTLKADLTSEYVRRLQLGLLRPLAAPASETGLGTAVALHQNYFKDVRLFRRGRVDDAALVFSNPTSSAVPRTSLSTASAGTPSQPASVA